MAAQAQGGIKGVFGRKIGPLPTWAWIVIVASVIIGWAYLKARGSKTSTRASSTPASAIPEFVNQTYVQPQPPVAYRPDHDDDKDEDESDRRRHKRRHPTHHKHHHSERPPDHKNVPPPRRPA